MHQESVLFGLGSREQPQCGKQRKEIYKNYKQVFVFTENYILPYTRSYICRNYYPFLCAHCLKYSRWINNRITDVFVQNVLPIYETRPCTVVLLMALAKVKVKRWSITVAIGQLKRSSKGIETSSSILSILQCSEDFSVTWCRICL